MRFLFAFLFLIVSFTVNAQTKNADYKNVDKTIKKYSNPIDEYAVRDVASFIDSTWHLIDPILHYPISTQEFYDGRTEINKEKPFFNYLDTLAGYENETRMEQLIATNRRIIKTEVIYSLTKTHLENNEKEIDAYKQQIAVECFNLAANYFNDGVNFLNEFIMYRNNQFLPQKNETEIWEMIEKAENELLKAQNKLKNISTSDKNLIDMTFQLQNSILEIAKQLYEHKSFVSKYFSTSNPAHRKLLFTRQK